MRMTPKSTTYEVDLGVLGEAFRYPVGPGTQLSIDGAPLVGTPSTGVLTLKRAYGASTPRGFTTGKTFATGADDDKVIEIDLTATEGGFTDLVGEVTTTESGIVMRITVVETDPT